MERTETTLFMTHSAFRCSTYVTSFKNSLHEKAIVTLLYF